MSVSRDQFDEKKNWTEPQWQEGVPVMDADLNLAMKIGKTGLRRAVCDFLGNGSPNDGFKLSGAVADPTISAGGIWVAGLKIELPEDIQASAQPNAPVTFPAGDGVWYLDIVEILLTNADDPDIRDSRLPANVETPVKVWKTDWTLRKVLGASLPGADPDHYHIGIALEAGGVFTDIRNTGMVLAGADTGYQDSVGGQPGSGHRHRDEDIDVENPNFSGDKLDEVLDEIDSRIENVEGGGGAVGPHAASHAAGGSDPVDIAGLPGQCTQGQISPAHSGLHTASFNGGLPISPDVNGNASLGAHLADPAIHRKNHNDLLAMQGGVPTERYHLPLDLYNAATGASGANAANPFATLGDISGVTAKFAAPVQTVQNLRDISSADRSDKQVRLIEDKGALYRFDDTGTGTDDGDGIITPTSGSGRWFKISSATPDLSTVLTKGNNAGSKRITGLLDPQTGTDAATKSYVDSGLGGIDVTQYKYPDVLVDAGGSGDAADIPTAFGLIPTGADRHIAFRRGDYELDSNQVYNIGGLLCTGAGEASRIYSSGAMTVLTLSAGNNNIVKITGFMFDNVRLVVNGAKEVHIAECVFNNSDLYIGTGSEPVEWAVVEKNRFIETEIFYPGTAGDVDHITIKNNYFKRTGQVSSGILDIWWNPDEIFILDNVIDVSGVTDKNVNPDWYYIIDANTTRYGVVRGNTIIMPEANPANQVVGIEASGDTSSFWVIEGNKFVSNLVRGVASVGHAGVEAFTNDPEGPFFLVSGNYFVDFNVNQGETFSSDFSIIGSGTYVQCLVVRNNIHKNCNQLYFPLTGMNVSGDVIFA